MRQNKEALQGVLSLKVDWQEYARLYKVATGDRDRSALNRLELIGEELIEHGIVSPTRGYMINNNGVLRDFIEAYDAPLKTRIVSMGDAQELAVALGFRKEDAIFID